MAGNLISMDTQFPQSTGNAEQDIKKIYGYLYTLLEGLRYTLSNLGKQNFSEAAYEEISNDVINKEISEMTITVTPITQGSTSTKIKIDVGNVSVESGEIDLTGVVQFWNLEDSQDTTIINGATITTGTMNACTFNSVLMYNNSTSGQYTFKYKPSAGADPYDVGKIYMQDLGSASPDQSRYRIVFETTSLSPKFALKLKSSGDMSINSGSDIYMGDQGENVHIGNSGNPGRIDINGQVYINGQLIQ